MRFIWLFFSNFFSCFIIVNEVCTLLTFALLFLIFFCNNCTSNTAASVYINASNSSKVLYFSVSYISPPLWLCIVVYCCCCYSFSPTQSLLFTFLFANTSVNYYYYFCCAFLNAQIKQHFVKVFNFLAALILPTKWSAANKQATLWAHTHIYT